MTKNSRWQLWCIVLAGIGVFLYQVSDILFPFVVAILIGYFMVPIVDWLERKLPRGVATALVILLLYLILATICLLLLPAIYDQCSAFAANIPKYKAMLEHRFIPYVANKISNTDPAMIERGKKIVASFSSGLSDYFLEVLNHLWQSGIAFVHLLSLLFLTPIIAFYFLRDWHNMTSKLMGYIPRQYLQQTSEQLKLMNLVLSAYLRGQLNVCMVMSVYYVVLLWIFGLDFSLLIGVASGFLVFIPYLGWLIALIVSVCVCFFQFGSFSSATTVIIIYVVGNVLEGSIISPNLIGDRVGLHPVWMIFAIMAAGSLCGLYGILLAIPVAAMIGVLARSLSNYYFASLK